MKQGYMKTVNKHVQHRHTFDIGWFYECCGLYVLVVTSCRLDKNAKN